jgi:RNA-directed DNA polymerase
MVKDIDINLIKLWEAWKHFRRGKRKTREINIFSYNLEREIFCLNHDIFHKTYRHVSYYSFVVKDNKKRKVSVANIRDRVVHRLLYDYLVLVYDKSFSYDAWSCRKNKGLIGAISRIKYFAKKYPSACCFRGDIKKFFDSVSQEKLIKILERKINGDAMWLAKEIISSYQTIPGLGMPIGNLTSQIFANIYLNEFDRFVMHFLKPICYVRYGDDFIIFANNEDEIIRIKDHVEKMLDTELKLKLNSKNNYIFKCRRGIKMLGVIIWGKNILLNKRINHRWKEKLNLKNSSSYRALVCRYGKKTEKQIFNWKIAQKL